MRDPFPIEPLPWLTKATQPYADALYLPSLSLHIHEVLASALLYTVIFKLSPLFSTLVVGDRYRTLGRKRRVNWDAHVVSMVQSVTINALALWIIWADDDRAAMDAEARVWGYTGACGMIQALAAGYFLWDLIVTSLNFDVFGIGTLAHAISALLVYSFGFRPFVNYYAPIFILWELSTPFLNVHWFFDKLGMTGTRAQLYNGLLLISTFFSARLVYGTYQSYCVFSDIWAAMGLHPSGPATVLIPSSEAGPELAHVMLHPDDSAVVGEAQANVMRFAGPDATCPLWLAAAYLASNITLNFLNFYWFIMMIRAVRKRFVPSKEGEGERESKEQEKDKNNKKKEPVVVVDPSAAAVALASAQISEHQIVLDAAPPLEADAAAAAKSDSKAKPRRRKA